MLVLKSTTHAPLLTCTEERIQRGVVSVKYNTGMIKPDFGKHHDVSQIFSTAQI
jgi:hypothetical protein